MRAFAVLVGRTCLAAAHAGPGPGNPGLKAPITFAALRDGFAQPDMRFAPFAFWFWDEPLDTAKMARMAARMASVGMNPGYAHARMSMVGTPSLPDEQWLGDAWFQAFDAALAAAREAGTHLGYCDEYWWPSFQAHGRVLARHPELRAVSLAWRTLDVKAGETVALPECRFAVAARRVEAAPSGPSPASPRLGQWIWSPGSQPVEQTCGFRRAFEVPPSSAGRSAVIRVTCDNAFRLWLDGRLLGASDDWHLVQSYDVTERLAPGRHVLAVEARNLDGPAGLTLGLEAVGSGGSALTLQTDAAWKASPALPAGWEQPGFDDTAWRPAAVLGPPDAAPWHLSAGAADAHSPTTIRSATLRVLTARERKRWTAPAGSDWRVYAYTLSEHAGVDGGEVNCLDPRLAPAFIEIALKPYAARYGSELGKSIPGDFIDHEGAYGWRLAWSDALADRYRRRYGADLRSHLPLMADADAEGMYAAVRWRWYDLVSELYAGQFAAVTDWHEKRGMSTTAHVWEESLQAQVYAVGDHMRLLRALTMPGQDCLGTKALEPHDFKEAASVAEFGGRRAATELMGAGGWGVMTPEFLKQSANAVTAWGMSHVIPHAVFSQRKLAGNPWPPDFYEVNPMFPYLRVWTDFIRRTSYVNSHGHAVPDVLLYNPLESLWTLADAHLLHQNRQLPGLVWTWPEDNPAGVRANAIDAAYRGAIDALTDARVEFLVGDRHYVRQMRLDGSRLRLGPFAFGAVVLPPLEVLPTDVARTLAAFAEAGGRVYALGELPRASAERGAGDPGMAALAARLRAAPTFRQCSGSLTDALQAQAPGLVGPVRFLSPPFPMWQRRMQVDGRDLYWLANRTGLPQTARLEFRGASGHVEAWDAETGTTRPLTSRATDAGSEVELALSAHEGLWVVFDTDRTAQLAPQAAEAGVLLTIEGPWRARVDPAAQPPLEFPVALPPGAGERDLAALDDWSAWLPARFSGVVDYTVTFDAPALLGRVTLDLGTVHHVAEVVVNGQPCGARIWAPHRYDITAAVRRGANQLRVRVCNLVNNNYGDVRPSGLKGPVRVILGGGP